MIQLTYTSARERLAELLERVTNDHEVVIVTRRDRAPVALIDAAELSSLLETAHLLRSPRNAARLQEALAQSERGEGERITIEQLRKELDRGKTP